MSNGKFLSINKSLFGIGLNPIELLIVSQVLEFEKNDLDCFISDEALAKNFGVSESTVSRAISGLKRKNILAANTKNTQKGKIRYLTVLTSGLEALSNSQNDSCENQDKSISNSQNDSCGNVNLPISNKQNDSIKDNIKNKTLKDNNEIKQPQAAVYISLENDPKDKVQVVKEVMKNSTTTDGKFKF